MSLTCLLTPGLCWGTFAFANVKHAFALFLDELTKFEGVLR